jgi:hypothetical protein
VRTREMHESIGYLASEIEALLGNEVVATVSE